MNDRAPISQIELAQMFGPTMPLEAVNLLFTCSPDMEIGELRLELLRIAGEHRARERVFVESDERLTVTITRGELARLDVIITFMSAMAEHFSTDFYDDMWNLRNAMVPFEPGHPHYDDPED